MKNRNIIVHSDKITKGRSKLNLSEMKVFLATITTIDAKNDDEFKEITLDRQDFCEDTNLDFRTVKSVCRTLLKQVYEIETEKVWEAYPIYQVFKYDKDTGEIKFKFNDYMRPYLLKIVESFTKYQIKNIINMTSKYSIRIYQILKDLRNVTRQKEFELEEFCDWLEVPKNKRRWGNLQFDILELAKKEINELTDIKILGIYPERKKGKKVLSFSIKFITSEELDNLKQLGGDESYLTNAGLREIEIFDRKLVSFNDKYVMIDSNIRRILSTSSDEGKIRVLFSKTGTDINFFWFNTIKDLEIAVKNAETIKDTEPTLFDIN